MRVYCFLHICQFQVGNSLSLPTLATLEGRLHGIIPNNISPFPKTHFPRLHSQISRCFRPKAGNPIRALLTQPIDLVLQSDTTNLRNSLLQLLQSLLVSYQSLLYFPLRHLALLHFSPFISLMVFLSEKKITFGRSESLLLRDVVHQKFHYNTSGWMEKV